LEHERSFPRRSIKMKRAYLLMFVFLVLFWPAFIRTQKSASKARVEIIDGVEYIHNTGTPLYLEKTVTFVEDLSISAEDKDGNIVFIEPWLSFVDDNENIYIIERRDQVIKVFKSDGKQIKTIGAKGSGPGEFQTIMPPLAVTKDGKLLVQDANSRRTSFFDSSGRFIKSFQSRKSSGKFLLIKETSFITSSTENSRDSLGGYMSITVKEVDFNGNERQIEGEFAVIRYAPIRVGGMLVYYNEPVVTTSEFAGDQDRGRFYHCINNKYLIEVYDSSGKIFRKIDRPYKPVRFTDTDASNYRASIMAPNEEIRKAIMDREMPKEKSVVEEMLVDDHSNLWIQTNEKKIDGDKILTAFDIFDSEGNYFAKIWTAAIPSIFKKGKMYMMEKDQDTGYKTLKRYKVIWK
jgi:hypothetical protein